MPPADHSSPAGANPPDAGPGRARASDGTQAAARPGPDVLVTIRALLPALAPAERRIAETVLRDPAAAAGRTITALAHACATSETTVIRFARAVGFSGYPELRLALAAVAGREGQAAARVIGSDIGPGDSLAQVVEKIGFADARAVEETTRQLDLDMLGRVVDALVAARRIDIYGVGASALVGADLQRKLHRIGRFCNAWGDPHMALTSAALLEPGDVAVGISHTGTTIDTIDALVEARRHGATTVALTNFPRSAITGTADLVLITAARETTFRSGAMASRHAQLTVVDCVFVGVAQRTFPETRRALERTRAAVRSRRVDQGRGHP
jgi:DNA-binding MurR/RpiR family transcriptional regulator